MTLIVDADTMVYAAGFAVAKTAGPVSHATHALDMTLQNVVDALKIHDLEVYLTGPKGSASRIEIYPEYKANRKDMEKPPHYEDLREHLVVKWGAEICMSMEADDMVSVRGYDSVDNVMVSIDKDLLNTPGFHYNWRKGELKSVSTHVANRNFYTQALVGDTADNIKGVKGVGPKTAEKILDGALNVEELYTRVLDTYLEKGYDHQYMHDTCNVLWIARELDIFGNPIPWLHPHVYPEKT